MLVLRRLLQPSLASLLGSLRIFTSPRIPKQRQLAASIRPHPTATAASGGRQQQPSMAAAPAGSAASVDVGSSSETLLAALAIPPAPGFSAPGARVEHLLASRDGLLSELLTEALKLPEARVLLVCDRCSGRTTCEIVLEDAYEHTRGRGTPRPPSPARPPTRLPRRASRSCCCALARCTRAGCRRRCRRPCWQT